MKHILRRNSIFTDPEFEKKMTKAMLELPETKAIEERRKQCASSSEIPTMLLLRDRLIIGPSIAKVRTSWGLLYP